MESLLLDNIDQPSDLKNLDKEQVNKLCAEIRQFLLRNISRTGGHLASNLGAVELTVALHRVMTTPMDKIVFDVGHQCYTHKILTGRKDVRANAGCVCVQAGNVMVLTVHAAERTVTEKDRACAVGAG